MERLLRLAQFWSWLPAFRAVAETQHLPTAALELRLSPSALSRTIRLLERELGQPLFARRGRNLFLAPAGEELLLAVRDAMRRVDDGVALISGLAESGPLHLSIAGPFNVIAPAVLDRLRLRHPDLVPRLHHHVPGDAPPRLLRGDLDLVVTPDPVAAPGLSVEPVAIVTAGVYCGRGHALHRARKVTIERVLEHDFAAPIASESPRTGDGWPPHFERRVAVYVQHIIVALALCARGGCLAVFPDCVVESDPRARDLSKLPLDVIPPTRLWAMRRRRLAETDPASLALDAVRAAFAVK